MAESTVGPWARDKLQHLEKYLVAYTTILSRQRWCEGFVYIDAFADPGRHRLRNMRPQTAAAALLDMATPDGQEHEELINGSPRVALDLSQPFTWYVFVDKSPERVQRLNSLKSEYGKSRKIAIRRGDCNEYLLKNVAQSKKIDWSTHRALVFLDPFGMQVPWSTIEALAKTKAIEVFLNFPVGMAIQRLLLRRGEFTERQRAKLDEYFGSPDWYDVLYRKRPNLFGDEDTEKIKKSGEALLRWYRHRLKEQFGHASRAALLRNSRKGHLYYLLLATPNAKGLKIANHVLAAGESV